ncbi:MAG: hypothetical protein M0R39_13270 [Prolixibacteraceae bacterium]|nr:hypothetical protein [Prolixibacteraceae bacterium]
MVRLGDPSVQVQGSASVFQFHDGSIGRSVAVPNVPEIISVSIPRWFDWELLLPVFLLQLPDVSIPRWFDWE